MYVHLYENPSFSRLLPPAGGGGGGGGGGNTESGPETLPESGGGGGGGIDSCTLSKGRRRKKLSIPFSSLVRRQPPSAPRPTERLLFPEILMRRRRRGCQLRSGADRERRFSVFFPTRSWGRKSVSVLFVRRNIASFSSISAASAAQDPPPGRGEEEEKEKVGISLSIWENC